MTRCVIHCPLPVEEYRYVLATQAASFEPILRQEIHEFGSTLFRDEFAIGLLWSVGCLDGIELVEGFRRGDIKNPLLVMVEQGNMPERHAAALDRAKVLYAGADDVQPAGLDYREIAARLKAIAERGIYFDHLHVDLPNGCTFIHDRQIIRGPTAEVHLTQKECTLFSAIARRSGTMVSKQQLMDALYGDDDEPMLKIIDVFVCKIRRKILEATNGIDCIRTIWGQGYSFVPEGFRVARDQFRTRGIPRWRDRP